MMMNRCASRCRICCENLASRLRRLSQAKTFLTSECLGQTECLVLDIAMQGVSGLDVQRELKARKIQIPIVFITAHKDETVRQYVLDEGAAGFLLKPFSDTALLQALRAALGTN